MKSLLLKGMPEDWHKRLKERAEAHRRSLNQEALSILAMVLQPYEIPEPRKVYKLKRPLTTRFIQQAIQEGQA